MATAKKTPAAKTPGTAVAVKSNKTGVVSIQDEIRRKAEAMSDRMDPASGSTIRVTQSKSMKLPNGQEVEEIDLVVVDFTATQNFYPGKFDSKNLTPPDCFAIGDNPKKLVPSLHSPNLQIDKKDAVEARAATCARTSSGAATAPARRASPAASWRCCRPMPARTIRCGS